MTATKSHSKFDPTQSSNVSSTTQQRALTLYETLKRSVQILFGYGCAVLMATFVTVMMLSLKLQDIAPYLLIGAFYTAVFAALPAAIFILVCEATGRPGQSGHMAAGAITAILAHVGFAGIGGGSFYHDSSWLIVASTVGGAIGAYIYWKLAVASLETNASLDTVDKETVAKA